MKFNGNKIVLPPPVEVTIYRVPEPIVFKCATIVNYEEFDKAFPAPKIPMVTKVGGDSQLDPEDPDYLEKLKEWREQRYMWMVLKSISATDGLEFETVDLADPPPSTYENFDTEMAEVFTPAEIGQINRGIMQANAPNEQSFQQALDVFQRSQEAKAKTESKDQSSESGEPQNIKSGEPANA